MEGAGMKRLEREIYGFGPRLSTRHDRVARIAFIVMFASVAGMVVGLLWV
jgi:hypothetical protein